MTELFSDLDLVIGLKISKFSSFKCYLVSNHAAKITDDY